MLRAGSAWPKLILTAIVVGGFVSLYEVTMLDSKKAATESPVTELAARAPLEPGTSLDFVATAYCKGLTTKSGVAVQSGIAAADPSLLPVGSVVEVDSHDSRYDGIYTILDTGPAIRGAMVDIYMWSCHEALKFGRKPIRLRVLRLGWNPRATAPGFMDRLIS